MLLLAALAIVVAQGSAPAPTTEIAFTRLTEGHWQIWSIRPDGSGAVQWTFDPSDKRNPSWLPDGDGLVYNDLSGRVFVVDGSGERTVLPSIAAASEVEVSNAGRLVQQCVRYEPTYLVEVWTSGLDGADRRSLTRHPLHHLSPAWAPAGDRLVAAEYDPREEQFGLVVLSDVDQSRQVLLSGTKRYVGPTWSADGTRIAYALDDRGNHDIWVLDLASGEQQRRTHDPDRDSDPAFSPDSRSIAFVSRRTGTTQIWSVPTDGGVPVQITSGSPCRDPAWGSVVSKTAPIVAPSVTQTSVDGQESLEVAVSFDVQAQCSARLEVAEAATGALVYRGAEADLMPGRRSLRWSPAGEVDEGVYLARIVTDGWTWAPSSSSGGMDVRPQRVQLVSAEALAKFSLTETSLVRVRFGFDEGPMIATPLDFVAMPPGDHEIRFEASLPHGWPDFWTHPRRFVWVTAVSLPANAVVVGRPDWDRRSSPVQGPDDTARRSRHASHSPEACRDPEIGVTLLQGDEPLPLDESGVPVATSTVTIRVDVPDASAKALLERGRFEVMIFMDDFFLIEDEDSVVPFHFTLDLGRFPDGDHAILVNVAGYSDHVGARFAPFRIERGR